MVPTEGAFLPNDYKLCVDCASKFEGKSGVKEEADRIMVEVKIDPNFKCMNCGNPVIVNGNHIPLYCTECSNSIYKTFKEFTQ